MDMITEPLIHDAVQTLGIVLIAVWKFYEKWIDKKTGGT